MCVIAAARAWVGTPYHHQASCMGAGCDCLGLLRGVWRRLVGPESWLLPPYSRDWGEAGAQEVLRNGLMAHFLPLDGPRPGAVALFRMRDGALAKHAAILTGAGMVHAREKLGVIEEPFTRPWQRRAVAFFAYPLGEA